MGETALEKFKRKPTESDPLMAKFRAKPTAEPESGTVALTNDPTADEYAHPNYAATAVRALGEGFGVGPLARRITAAGQTVLPKALGGTDGTYDENLASEEARVRGGAEDSPEVYAPARAAGGVLGAVTMGPGAYASSAAGNAALETPGDWKDKALAAAKAGATNYALGKVIRGIPGAAPALSGKGVVLDRIGKYLSTPSLKTGAALGAASAARTIASDAPDGEKGAAALEALFPLVTARYAGRTKQSKAMDEPIRRSDADLYAKEQEHLQKQAMERAAQEKSAVDSLERERTQAASQNVARAGVADAAINADERLAAKDARKVVANNVDRRGADDDKQQRTYQNAKDKLSANKAAEKLANDRANLNFQNEMARLNKEHETIQAAWQAKIDSQRDIAAKVDAQTSQMLALESSKKKILAEYQKETQRLTEKAMGEGMTPEEAAASAHGALGQIYGEAHTRSKKLLDSAEAGAIDENPMHREVYEKSAQALDKNTPRVLTDFREIDRVGAEAWEAADAARRLAKANAGDPSAKKALEGRPAVPTDLDAQAATAMEAKASAKKSMDPSARTKVNDILRENGIDPTTLTDEQIIAGGWRTPEAPKPVNAADALKEKHDQASRDVRKQKLDAWPTVLPDKPDRLATKQANRVDRVNLRNRTPLMDDVTRMEAGRDSMMPVREPLRPDASAGETVGDRTTAAKIRAIQNLRNALDDAKAANKGVKPTPGRQFLKETQDPAIQKALHAALAAGIGGGVGGVPGVIGGAYLGSKATHAPESVVSKYLGKSMDQEGVERFSTPAEANVVMQGARNRLDKGRFGQREDLVKARKELAPAAERAAIRGADDEDDKKKETPRQKARRKLMERAGAK